MYFTYSIYNVRTIAFRFPFAKKKRVCVMLFWLCSPELFTFLFKIHFNSDKIKKNKLLHYFPKIQKFNFSPLSLIFALFIICLPH